ncbi:MAG TPA: GTPase domain-containing protein, partial [Thermoanaerobaculia bacterium]|nr:GTPase domain-containing protein [Thermoanaerobaculia bacterium]
MVLFNHSTRELTAKIVYYGPGLCGKTTNLRLLHEKLDQGTTGRLLSLSTAQDRTIYFDLLPVELGNVKGYTVRFQLCTVPGQVFYNETRKLVLKGADGIVFVVDSQWSMLSHNLESFQNLRENMAELGQKVDEAAVVIQYNKRDLPGVLSVQALQESLGFQEFPFVESIAADAKGVVETFKLVSKLTFIHILKRLQRSPDGERLGPDWVAPSPPNSQSTARIPPVSAQLLALASTVGPVPTPPTESPFETTGSWPGLAKGEVFSETTIPPFPIEPPVEPPAEPPAE